MHTRDQTSTGHARPAPPPALPLHRHRARNRLYHGDPSVPQQGKDMRFDCISHSSRTATTRRAAALRAAMSAASLR